MFLDFHPKDEMEMIQFDDHMFQRCWNHQVDSGAGNTEIPYIQMASFFWFIDPERCFIWWTERFPQPAIFMLCKIPVLRWIYRPTGRWWFQCVVRFHSRGIFLFCSYYKHIFRKGLEKTSGHSWYWFIESGPGVLPWSVSRSDSIETGMHVDTWKKSLSAATFGFLKIQCHCFLALLNLWSKLLFICVASAR